MKLVSRRTFAKATVGLVAFIPAATSLLKATPVAAACQGEVHPCGGTISCGCTYGLLYECDYYCTSFSNNPCESYCYYTNYTCTC